MVRRSLEILRADTDGFDCKEKMVDLYINRLVNLEDRSSVLCRAIQYLYRSDNSKDSLVSFLYCIKTKTD